MKENETNTQEITPFDGIGLCFSGGGYRATFFALGVVSYLNKVTFDNSTLLSRVRAVSSVSGGTLLAVAYSKAAQSSDFNFESFYQEFYNQFNPENDTLLSDAVDKLEDSRTWAKFPHKKRSIINAFALTYAEMPIFNGAFDVYYNPKNTELKDVCFNSTEFSFGLPFRFQNTGFFGNKPLQNPHSEDLKNEVVLGDVVASSSCFPLGFEPLIFPDDYFSNQSSEAYKALKKEDNFKEGIGVMDGGIADNQGIESMINITKRSANKDRFNLVMVNDVASYKMVPWTPYTEPVGKKKPLKTTLRKLLSHLKVKWWYIALVVLGLLIAYVNTQDVFGKWDYVWLHCVSAVLIVVGLLLTFVGWKLGSIRRNTENWIKDLVRSKAPEVLLNDVLSFQNLETDLLKRMLTERLTSGAKMINDVFLKQIRRLNYDMLYNEETLDDKRITSTVYQLNGEKTIYGNNSFNDAIQPKPSAALNKTSLIASQTPTTLWWDKEDISVNRMDCLIACGQFTTCYNLLDYVIKLRAKGYDSEPMKTLEDALIEDWKALNDNPLRWVKPQ